MDMETLETPCINFLTDVENRLHFLRLKILDASERWIKARTNENGKKILALAEEKKRVQQKYGVE